MSAGLEGMYHHAWLQSIFLKLAYDVGNRKQLDRDGSFVQPAIQVPGVEQMLCATIPPLLKPGAVASHGG